MHTFGPHGVNDLVRQSLNAVWRHLPDEGRTFDAAAAEARTVFDRNIRAWRGIKQPSPAAFFENLGPSEADQFMRQAMVTCWMMMPRAGGRQVGDAIRIFSQIFQRTMDAWAEDHETFTGQRARKKAPAKVAAKKKPASKSRSAKPATKKSTRSAARGR